MSTVLYKRHRFPAEIIRYCVWLYYRFGLSFLEVEELLFERGVKLSYETVRAWREKFGRNCAENSTPVGSGKGKAHATLQVTKNLYQNLAKRLDMRRIMAM